MTPGEFKQWLRGYLTDRENPDVTLILEQAEQIDLTPVQYQPFWWYNSPPLSDITFKVNPTPTWSERNTWWSSTIGDPIS